ncbi:hypothetical protein J7T55_013663 [Diaporthe amygdali]|uniref:uncharacterized protein n=1 Tax=Phomopsis amygdali TaxID=1214568 RepID=UPI0022FE69D7|nr:uncharacterized protein J7T55_013663 [Diaporthe amygdali]KAJ0119461.1 hypothetical protein J7T55_013663 [Diaporthe amygdali]
MAATTQIGYEVEEVVLQRWLTKHFGPQFNSRGVMVWKYSSELRESTSWWIVTGPRLISDNEQHRMIQASVPQPALPFGPRRIVQNNGDMNEKFELPWPRPPSPSKLAYNFEVRKILESTGHLFVSKGPVEVHIAWVDSEDPDSAKRVEVRASYLDEGFGGYDWAESVEKDGILSGFESCYLLKYVQKRARARPGTNPWSISQALVYQKVSFGTERTDHIFIKPSDALASRLNHCLNQEPAVAAKIASDWTHVHRIAFGSVDEPFRDCFNHLDERISEIFGRVMMSGVEPGNLREFDTLESSSKDMKSLQAYIDMALRVKHIIDMNLETLDAMTRAMSEIGVRDSFPRPTQTDSLHRSLNKMRQQHRLSIKNYSSMIERAKSISEQLRNTISIRNSAATIELTVRSGYEAHVVKILTVLALIFLPASFVSMGYVSKVQSAGFKLSATDDLQIYAVLAIPLMVTTMLVYGGVELYQHRSWKKSTGSRGSII